jgi:hypothetical protein
MGRATADGPSASFGNRMVPHLRRRRSWLLAIILMALVAGFVLGLTQEGATPERPLAPDVTPNQGLIASPTGAGWTSAHSGIET